MAFKWKHVTKEGVARGVVLGVNLIFLLLGIGVVVAAIILSSKFDQIKQSASLLNDLDVQLIAIIVALCGALILAASTCGILGAWKRWRKVLIFYSGTLFLVVLIQLAMGIYLRTLSAAALETKWHESTPDERQGVQTYLQCCGWNSVSDSIPYPDCTDTNVPVQTCHDATVAFINRNIYPIAGVAIGIGVLEIITLICACMLIFTGKAPKQSDGFEDYTQ